MGNARGICRASALVSLLAACTPGPPNLVSDGQQLILDTAGGAKGPTQPLLEGLSPPLAH